MLVHRTSGEAGCVKAKGRPGEHQAAPALARLGPARPRDSLRPWAACLRPRSAHTACGTLARRIPHLGGARRGRREEGSERAPKHLRLVWHDGRHAAGRHGQGHATSARSPLALVHVLECREISHAAGQEQQAAVGSGDAPRLRLSMSSGMRSRPKMSVAEEKDSKGDIFHKPTRVTAACNGSSAGIFSPADSQLLAPAPSSPPPRTHTAYLDRSRYGGAAPSPRWARGAGSCSWCRGGRCPAQSRGSSTGCLRPPLASSPRRPGRALRGDGRALSSMQEPANTSLTCMSQRQPL